MTAAPKILVVDDHADLAENIAEILASAGYATEVAHSAENALERVEGDSGIAALITDFRLPGRNGAELIAELRARGHGMPAVVMSAYTDEQTVGSAEAAGAMEVLAKPVAIGRLLSIAELMGRGDAVVLVVDDNRALAENLAEALESRGYDTLVGTSVADALAAWRPARAAVLDVRLPDGTGVELAKKLIARHPSTRVLFISGHSEELARGLEGQLADAPRMEKPIDLGRLLAWVAAALDHDQAKRPRR